MTKKKKQKKENHKNNKEDFNDRKNGTFLSMEQIQYFVNLKPILMKGYETKTNFTLGRTTTQKNYQKSVCTKTM